MSAEQFPHGQVEQDRDLPKGGDELPTYDDLAAQSGPNSRFGRWRGWIEKRAAERYIDISPEERNRRRERGWGNEGDMEELEGEASTLTPILITEPPTPLPLQLHIQTNDLNPNTFPAEPPPLSPPLPPLPLVSQKLRPTHLKLNQFGSRFLPHTTSAIRCLLPLASERVLLVGHDEGLSVLDMFPHDWAETGSIALKGPDEAQARLIWQGESVYQMSILEVETTGEGSPQGVVLALVGPDPDSPSSKDQESLRTLRMYNLASLTSLAKWAISQKGARPLDLRRPSNWHAQQTPAKKHRPQSSIARSLKQLIESPNNTQQTPEPSTTSYHSLLSPSPSVSSNLNGRNSPSNGRLTPNRPNPDESSWDLVEDLPLRWATDFVPLASAGSRLISTSVICYAMWSDEKRRGKGGQMLAVATKSNILLYETPRGERAFRFVKEFYTPMTPRSITFFQQSVQEITRSHSEVGTPAKYVSHTRSDSSGTIRGGLDNRGSAASPNTVNYGPQLSLFVIFDKKAGWIRLADSAVGEMDLFDHGNVHQHSRESLSPTLGNATLRKSRPSMDGHSSSGRWVPIVRCELPIPSSQHHPASSRTVHLLTRGKQTHIVPCPLPMNSSSHPPLRVITWRSPPTHVTPRVCDPSSPDMDETLSYLQLVALGGENGVEVQEISLSFLTKGKGKARSMESLRADEDLGGDTGFLCTGGHWDHPNYPYHPLPLNRSYSTASDMSASSFNSMASEDIVKMLKQEEGIYGWCRKGLEDWRVFWLGGSLADDGDDEDDES